ncbi:MAG: bifunctional methylenetetrahydrofolate dehydrogenase/methenyltetrahydrofolate cyclohydrolase [Actinobacteria bacterium]|nr:bifunctional methylenetetrahydrofolate dehydrogenase/methenyltetrahydrofolate cyclohydrolase [Actinomycetota bacterium]
MMATVLDGNAVLSQVKAELKARVDKLTAAGITPGLGTVLVGDNPASAKYIEMKQKNCRELGIAPIHQHIPVTGSQSDLDAVIDRFNADPAVDAYLVQLPLPSGFDQDSTLLRIDPAKDVDGLHPVNLGHLVSGTRAPRPCTPAGIQALLVHYGVPISGSDVVIIGRGLTVGKPLANLLSLKEPNANAAVTLLHTGVADVRPYVERADIVVAAAGSPGIVTADMVKPGAAVVQTGTTLTADGRYLPDVEDAAKEVAGWFSPVTGSVGPMTRAMLLTNCVVAAEARALRS